MSDHDSSVPGASGQPQGAVGGEVELPMEHTARVRATAARPPSTQLTVHDESPAAAPVRSSTELAEPSRRRRRRERDRRLEKRAIFLVLFLFVGGGAAALMAIDVFMPEEASTPVEVNPAAAVATGLAAPVRRPSGVISSGIEQSPDLPVLRLLEREGITIGAEGLPEVLALTGSANVSAQAALESCRFAFSVWELSPNKRFRFLSTCGLLKGQVLVGAYAVSGTKIRLSPLSANGVVLTTELSLERPTRATTSVSIAGAKTPMLAVKQRLTAIRPGLEGDGFRNAFAPRNNISPRVAAPAPRPAAPSAPSAPRDPILDLLEGQ